MKNIILKTVNKRGETISETPLQLKEGSIFVQKVPDKMTLAQANAVHDWMVEAFKKTGDDIQVVTIPQNIKFQVIEIVKDGDA